MKLTGASMKDKTIVLGCCLGILFSAVFLEERVLWDFGVVIKKSKQTVGSSQNFVKKEQTNTTISAIISDSFIPPVKSTHPSLLPNHIAYQQQHEFNFKLNPEMSLNQVILLTGKNYLQKNYQSVIAILEQVDLSQLADYERHDLEYWLADAFYQTGEYSKAQEIATSALEKNENDRLCLLLAMIYESQGNHKKAKKQYLKLATQYPNSDYISSARIKFRILSQP